MHPRTIREQFGNVRETFFFVREFREQFGNNSANGSAPSILLPSNEQHHRVVGLVCDPFLVLELAGEVGQRLNHALFGLDTPAETSV